MSWETQQLPAIDLAISRLRLQGQEASELQRAHLLQGRRCGAGGSAPQAQVRLLTPAEAAAMCCCCCHTRGRHCCIALLPCCRQPGSIQSICVAATIIASHACAVQVLGGAEIPHSHHGWRRQGGALQWLEPLHGQRRWASKNDHLRLFNRSSWSRRLLL